jgi:GNAT superfamily N-acetyltransferase
MGEVTSLAEALGAAIAAPSPLSKDQDLSVFTSGSAPLDDWLRQRALKAEAKTARTYTVARGSTVVGYYCLAAGSILRGDLPKKLQRNSPEVIPVMVLGRLAVDKRCQGHGIGAGMLKDAMLRCVEVSEIAGIRAMLVHAKDDEAAKFYKKFGFVQAELGPQTFLLPIETIKASL